MKLLHLVSVIVLAALATKPSRADDKQDAAKANHWAWKAPLRPAVPTTRDSGWARNPIDAFILARLEAAGLTPAAQASREAWIRRVTFDLIGLPPTPDEIDAFLQDTSEGAWDRVVDRLLDSPHYGERWGRHWLDLARFAESNGFEHDEVRPNAWRYRDYVIRAFNSDKPYDRFIREQLAGDEVAPEDPYSLVATGFALLGPDMTDAASQKQRRQNTLDDMTDTTGLVFLGLTVACARCHNHKFEPISIHDYYRLQAFFTAAEFKKDSPVADADQRALHAREQAAYDELTSATRTSLDAIEGPHRQRLYQARMAKLPELARAAHSTPEEQRSGAQRELVINTQRFLNVPPKELLAAMTPAERAEHDRLQTELQRYDSKKPRPLPTAMALAPGRRTQTFVLWRGEINTPTDEVQPGRLSILERESQTPMRGNRSALADWIAGPDNPLTARVMVNRLWQHHFGRGIVPTSSDFGVHGERPTHPELLDWLAREFVDQGWSLKRMHRLMLLSATYRQSTTASPATAAKDPSNLLFSRMNRLRLEGEAVRDALLAISGRLDRKLGGPGVLPPLAPEIAVGIKEWKVSPDPRDHVRRSVYLFARRNLRFPFLEPFDLPDSNQSCPKRERSTTAPQALALLNATDVAVAAKALATRLEGREDRIAAAYRLTLGRSPSAAEDRLAKEFLRAAPLSELCRALVNVNEFVYLD